MPQAGLFESNLGTPVGKQAGLNDPLTMEDQQLSRLDLLDRGMAPSQIDQLLGISTAAPQPDELSPEQGLLEELGYGARNVGEMFATGAGEIAEDFLGMDGVGSFLKGAGEYIGPSEEQEARQQAEEQWKQEQVDSGEWSEARKFASDAGEAVVGAAPSMVPTIVGGAATGLAAGAAGGPIAATVGAIVGAMAASAPLLYEESLQAAEQHGGDRNDPTVQATAAKATLAKSAFEMFAPVKALARLDRAGLDEVVTSVLARGGKDMVKDGMSEGMTEVAQLATDAIAHDPELMDKLTADEKRELFPYLVREYGKEAALSMIAGSALGGVMGATTGARSQYLQNARVQKQVDTLGQAAQQAGVTNETFEELAKTPEGVRKLREATEELTRVEQARADAREAEEYARQQGDEVPEPILQAVERAEARADAAHDKWISGEFGGLSSGELKAKAQQKSVEERKAALDKLGANVPIRDDVSTETLVPLANELDAARTARAEAKQKLDAAASPKRKTKLEKAYRNAVEVEAGVREKVAKDLQGRDPVAARKEFMDAVTGAEKPKTDDVQDSGRRKAVDEIVQTRYGQNVSPAEKVRRAKASLEKEQRRAPAKRERLTKDLERLNDKLDTLTDPAEISKTTRAIQRKTEQLDGTTPAVEAAKLVLQEYDAGGAQVGEALGKPEDDGEGIPTQKTGDNPTGGAADEAAPTTPSKLKAEVDKIAKPVEIVPDNTPLARDEDTSPEGWAVSEDVPAAAAAKPDLSQVDDTVPLDETKPGNYFDMTEDSSTVPVDQLVPVRARPEGIANAAKFMRAAGQGLMGKRKPISVRKEPDGTYTVMDGNSTFANMQQAGWKNIPVRVMDDAQFARESAPKFASKTGTETTVEGDVIVAKGPLSQRSAVEARGRKEGLKTRFEPTDAWTDAEMKADGPEIDRQRRWDKAKRQEFGRDTTIDRVEEDMRSLPEKDARFEYGASFDADGKLLDYGTNRDDNNIMVPQPKKAVTFTHSHPVSRYGDGDTPFSLGDILQLVYLPKLQTVRAVLGKTGQVIEMNATPELKAMNEKQLIDFLRPRMKAAMRSLALAPNGLSAKRLAKLEQEIMVRLLDQEGLLDYNIGLDDLTVSDEELINDAIDAAEAGAGIRDDAGEATPQAGEDGPGSPTPAGPHEGVPASPQAGQDTVGPAKSLWKPVEEVWRRDSMARYPKWDQILPVAEKLNPELGAFLDRVSKATGIQSNHGPIKKYDSALRKATQKADGQTPNFGRLADIVRGMFLTKEAGDGDRAVQAMIDDGRFELIDEGWVRIPASGYMDRKVTLRDRDTGMMMEVQLVEPEMFRAKEGRDPYTMELDPAVSPVGHDLYEQSRILPPGSPEREALEAQQRALYGGTVDRAVPSMRELYLSQAAAVPPAAAMDSKGRISTRFPSTKSREFDPLVDLGQIDTEAMRQSPDAFEFNMETVRQYDGWRHGELDADGTAEAFVSDVSDNLLFLHDQFDEATRAATSRWYDGARLIVDQWADTYGKTPETIAGVIAGLSPQKDWFMNLSLAERVLDITTFAGDRRWSPEMTATASEIFGKPQYADDIAAIKGKTLDQLSDPVQRAIWVRVFDEAHNPRSFREATTDGNWQGDPTGKAAWSSNAIIAKAISVIDNPTVENVSSQMGGNHKVRSFYNNIIAPMSTDGDVTIDTHAVGAGLLLPVSQSSQEVVHNFGVGLERSKQPENYRPPRSVGFTGAKGLYGLHADAYRDAAAKRGILPRQMQSITWEAVRTLFPAKWKTAKNNEAIRSVWRRVGNGEIDVDRAREEIVGLAGGVPVPDWLRSPAGQDAPRRSASYESGIPEASLRKRDGGSRTGGGGDAAGTTAAVDLPAAAGVGLSVGRDVLPDSWLGQEGVTQVTPEQMRDVADKMASEAGVDIASLSPGTGGWFNPSSGKVETEPSTALDVDGDPKQVRLFAAMMGDAFGQYSVLVAEENSNGNSTVVSVQSSLPAERLFELAREADPDAFGGFTPTEGGINMVVFDPEGAEAASQKALDRIAGEDPDVQVYRTKAQSDFIGDTGEEGFSYTSPTGSEATQLEGWQSGRARGATRTVFGLEGPKPLYVSRPVVSGGEELTQWAKDQGFGEVLNPEDMHTTILYSKDAVDTSGLPPKINELPARFVGKPVRMDNALVMKVANPALQAGHKRYRDAGGSHDYGDSYQPHVTFLYDPTPEDLKALESAKAFRGKVQLGAETQEPLRVGARPASARDLTSGWLDGASGPVLQDPLMGNKRGIWDGSEPGARRPTDAFNKWRHEWTDYDRESLFSNLLDKGFNGKTYRELVEKTRDKALAEINELPITKADRRAAMKAHVESWASSKLRQRFAEVLKPEHKRNLLRNMGEMLETGKLSEKEIAAALRIPLDHAQKAGANARSIYRKSQLPASAINPPPGIDIYPDTSVTWRDVVGIASKPMTSGQTGLEMLEDNFFNRFAPIRRLELRQRGELGQGSESAFKAVETAVNDSGRNEALMFYGASKLGAHGEYQHAPGTVGLRTIFDKAVEGASDKGQAMADWMGYMVARRISELRGMGNTMAFPMSDADVQTYLGKETSAFKEAAGMWQKHNEANVDFLVQTGRITKDQAKALKQTASFVPFYRSTMNADGSSPELDLTGLKSGPRAGSEILRRDPGIKALKGGDKKAIDNIMINMIRNSQAMTAAGMRNAAANKTFELMEDAGLAKTVKGSPSKKPDGNAVAVWIGGKKKWVIPKGADAEPLMLALAGLQPLQLGRIQSLMAGVGSIFRQGVTLSPAFMIRNAFRGAVATGLLTTGANIGVTNNTMTGFREAYNNSSATKAFKAMSGMGDYSFGNPSTGMGKNDILVEYGLAPKTIAYRIRKAIEAGERVGTATELADRVAAYRTMIERGTRPDEAAYQARAVMDYSRKGSLPELRAWLPMVPFLNARLQGFSRLTEGAVGKRGAEGRKQAMAQLALNGLTLMALSGALWARNAFDEENREKYVQEPLYRRLNYHIVYLGDKTLLLPKAFELGHIFSSIPELFGDAMVNDLNEIGPGVAKIAKDTVGFNLIPAAVMPIIEASANYSFFRGAPIEGRREQDMRARDRITGASSLSQMVGRQLGVSDATKVSPTMIEHFFQGYGGAYFLAAASALDVVAGEMGYGSAPVGGAFGDVPLASSALQRSLGSMWRESDQSTSKFMEEFYRNKDYVTQIMRSAKDAAANGDVEYARRLLDNAPAAPAAYKLVNKAGYQLSELNREIRSVKADTRMTPAQKRSKIGPIIEARNDLVRQVALIIDKLEEQQGTTFKRAS